MAFNRMAGAGNYPSRPQLILSLSWMEMTALERAAKLVTEFDINGSVLSDMMEREKSLPEHIYAMDIFKCRYKGLPCVTEQDLNKIAFSERRWKQRLHIPERYNEAIKSQLAIIEFLESATKVIETFRSDKSLGLMRKLEQVSHDEDFKATYASFKRLYDRYGYEDEELRMLTYANVICTRRNSSQPLAESTMGSVTATGPSAPSPRVPVPVRPAPPIPSGEMNSSQPLAESLMGSVTATEPSAPSPRVPVPVRPAPPIPSGENELLNARKILRYMFFPFQLMLHNFQQTERHLPWISPFIK